MSDVLFISPQGSGVVLEQFGIRRAVRMAAQRRGVSAHSAERAAMRSMAAHGDRSLAIDTGFQHLETVDAGRELIA